MSADADSVDSLEGIESKHKLKILPEDSSYDLSFKLIVIGDIYVGKSCLTNKAVKNVFSDEYCNTIGFEYFTFTIKVDNKIIRLQIWDTCGQEMYRSLITNFYRNTSLAIIVYAINNYKSFESIDSWLKELRKNGNPDVKIFLIGNKADLEEERKVSKELGTKFYQDNKMNGFMEASAKTGLNAKKIFVRAAELLYENYEIYNKISGQNSHLAEKLERANIQLNNVPKKKQKKCCSQK